MQTKTFSSLALIAVVVAIAGCGDGTPIYIPDMGPDLALPPQTTHIGPDAPTCCLTTLGKRYVLYLANFKPSGTDVRGKAQPATGELHLATPYGGDYLLGKGVPAFAYGFSPDGRFALFTSKAKENYALHFATLSFPNPLPPADIVVIPDGLTNDPLDQQSFYSPSGRYLITGVLPKKTAYAWDLHVVDMVTAKDIYHLGAGSFSYIENITDADTMIYTDSTSSTVAGVPSVQGLYTVPLASLVKGGQPVKLDTQISAFSLMADGHTLVYNKVKTGELDIVDTHNGYTAKAPTTGKVIGFAAGPNARGPIAYITDDHALHVMPKFGADIYVSPPNTVDSFSGFTFSPDGNRIYWFARQSSQDFNGDVMMINLPPSGDGIPRLLDRHVSSTGSGPALTFLNGRMIYVRNVDARGDTGDLVSSLPDGTDNVLLAAGVIRSELRQSFPQLPKPTAPPIKDPGPKDMSPEMMAPLFGVIRDAHRDANNTPVDSSSPLVGSLILINGIDGHPLPIADQIHSGAFRFSDDGYDVVYASKMVWDDTALNYVGDLQISATVIDRPGARPVLDGVSEIGPVRDRGFFLSAPTNSTHPGIYFIEY